HPRSFFFSSRRRHTRLVSDWSSDVCSSDLLKLPAAHNINSLLYEYHPQICDHIRKRGDEVVGHGRTNAERQGDLWELDESRLIRSEERRVGKESKSGW